MADTARQSAGKVPHDPFRRCRKACRLPVAAMRRLVYWALLAGMLAALAPSPAVASDFSAPLNCADFWDGRFPRLTGDPRDPPLARYQCVEWNPVWLTGAPDYRIFAPAHWAESLPPYGESVLNGAARGLEDSLPAIRSLGLELPPIHLVIATEARSDPGDPTSYTSELAIMDSASMGVDWLGFEMPCPAILLGPILRRGENTVSFVTAHEVFHCAQNANFNDKYGLSGRASNWWIEGSAELFAAELYPAQNYEHSNASAYLPDIAPTQQALSGGPRGYPNVLFFTSIVERRGVPRIIDLIRDLPESEDLDAQLDSIANGDMPDLLHAFGRDFVDDEIADPGGGTMPHGALEWPERPVAGDARVPIEVERFRVEGAFLDLEKGMRYEVTPRGTEDVTLSWRKDEGGSEWAELAATTPMTAPCDENLTVAVLATATAGDRGETLVHLDVAAEPLPEDECECADPDTRIDACLVGTWELDTQTVLDQMGAGAEVTLRHVSGARQRTFHRDGQTFENNDAVTETVVAGREGMPEIHNTSEVAVATAGQWWVTETGDLRICETADGTITTVARVGGQQVYQQSLEVADGGIEHAGATATNPVDGTTTAIPAMGPMGPGGAGLTSGTGVIEGYDCTAAQFSYTVEGTTPSGEPYAFRFPWRRVD